MALVDKSALVVVAIAGLYMLGLGVTSLIAPARARSFLLGFAGSMSLHFIEVLLRFLVGFAFVLHAPHMDFSIAFSVFGWVLIITTAGLFCIPWRLHSRFAQKTVPYATNYIALIGLSSLAIGGFIIVAIFRG